MKKSLICVILGIVLAGHSQGSSGQDIPRYTPQRPTISPYLNLLRNDNGSLPNYFSLVRPQQNQRNLDNQILSTTRSQARQVQELNDLAAGGTSGGATGSAGTYRNLSHFYPANRSHFYPAKQKGFQKR
ncbi:MAG: hypothetical protein NT138_00175 [Planctomycetales bacterium]|nr:hypothetical protein [Planctomycetales bacterium]